MLTHRTLILILCTIYCVRSENIDKDLQDIHGGHRNTKIINRTISTPFTVDFETKTRISNRKVNQTSVDRKKRRIDSKRIKTSITNNNNPDKIKINKKKRRCIKNVDEQKIVKIASNRGSRAEGSPLKTNSQRIPTRGNRHPEHIEIYKKKRRNRKSRVEQKSYNSARNRGSRGTESPHKTISKRKSRGVAGSQTIGKRLDQNVYELIAQREVSIISSFFLVIQ